MHLTKEEKLVVLVFIIILFCGSILQWSTKQSISIKNMMSLLENDQYYPKININSASVEDLERIPYLSVSTARNIIEQRNNWGRFEKIEDVQYVKGVGPKRYEQFKKYFKL